MRRDAFGGARAAGACGGARVAEQDRRGACGGGRAAGRVWRGAAGDRAAGRVRRWAGGGAHAVTRVSSHIWEIHVFNGNMRNLRPASPKRAYRQWKQSDWALHYIFRFIVIQEHTTR